MSSTPTYIGKYKVISQIGKGGMGAVYKALHPTLNKAVIIKKLTLTGNKDFIERFRREAQLMMDFRNENIVQVYDHFKENNAFHIVMEYVDGITLEQLINSKRFLPEEAALLIFVEICKSLKYAHDRNVIHRDIKPANILISKSGIVKLVDFGVSASLDAKDEDGLTKAGMTIGTPSYLAPEQISNARNRDKRSDIYSLGVMLYEMIIGKKPFRGGFNPEVIALIEKGKYLPPKKINPRIKSSIQRIIKKAMHHKVNRRYQDLGVVIKKLARHLKAYKTQDQINQTIKAYLEGNEDPFLTPKGFFKRFAGKLTIFLLISALLLGAAGVGVMWGMKKGLHYQWLYPERYGAFQILLKLRKGYKEIDEAYISGLVFQEENNSLSLMKDVSLEFTEIKELESNTHYALMSKPVFLPHHMYKLVLYAENEQFRENFYLSPLSLSQKQSTSLEPLQLSFALDETPPALPVEATCRVYAIHTKRDITSQTDIDVHKNSTWIAWNDFISGRNNLQGFVSGERYRLRYKHPDYYTKYYNLTIRPEQTKVTIDVNMTPIPGTLSVSSALEDIRLYINGSDRYLEGDRDRMLKPIPGITTTRKDLVLSPGTYALTAESGKWLFGANPATKTLTIGAREEIIVQIKESSNKNRLEFEVK